MKYTIILIMAFCFGSTYAQEESVFQPIWHYDFGVQPKLISSFDLLPEDIQEITTDFIKMRFGDYGLKMKFVDAQIFKVDSLLMGDNQTLKRNNFDIRQIPFYDLYFAFKDASLGISQYAINIRIDKFGQVIAGNFPQLNIDKKIIPLEMAKEYSDSLSLAKYPTFKIDKCEVSLKYDQDILMWEICYFTPFKGNKGYCFDINAHTNQLMNELYMLDDVIDNTPDCCPPSPIIINEIKK